MLDEEHKRDLRKIIGKAARWHPREAVKWDPHKAIDDLYDDMFPRAEGCWPFS